MPNWTPAANSSCNSFTYSSVRNALSIALDIRGMTLHPIEVDALCRDVVDTIEDQIDRYGGHNRPEIENYVFDKLESFLDYIQANE